MTKNSCNAQKHYVPLTSTWLQRRLKNERGNAALHIPHVRLQGLGSIRKGQCYSHQGFGRCVTLFTL